MSNNKITPEPERETPIPGPEAQALEADRMLEPEGAKTEERITEERIPETEEQLTDDQAIAMLEALLFASGEPLNEAVLANITELTLTRVRDLCAVLQEKYATDPRSGLVLRRLENTYCLTTRPDLAECLARLFRPQHLPGLSPAAYETLAAIAYNQPATRAQVETVRGVNSDGLINRLIERGLIEETGTLDTPGRPSVFSVTQQFLLDFGLQSTDELPAVDLLMYDSIREMQQD